MGDPASIDNREFDSADEAKKYIEEYNSRFFTNFVVFSSNSRQIVFRCKHGVERKSKCGGKRPKQHYNYMDCSAFIRLYKRNNQKFKVTKFDFTHNHPTTAAIHGFNNANLNDEDRHLILTLKEASAKTSQIKRVLCNRSDYRTSTQKIKNLITKLVTTDDTGGKNLEDFLSSMDEEGGTVKFTYDTDGCVDSLFLSSAKMKKKFALINPFSIQVDTTFNIEEGRYKLVAFCYLDVPCNKTEVAALAIIANEGEANFNFIFIELKALNNRNDYIFLVDKDFNSINCIERIFTEATILLCRFHVFKFLKTLVATAVTTVEIKNEIFAKFKDLTHTPSQSLYEDRRREFLSSIQDINIRVDQKYVSFTDYFNKNWDTCTPMWVKYHRNNLPLFGDHTTNRIERQFETFKQSLAETFSAIPKTSEAIIHLIEFINDRLDERNILTSTKRLVIFDSDPTTHDHNKEASKFLNEKGCILFYKALKSMSDREKTLSLSDNAVKEVFKNGESKLYPVTDRSCICVYFRENLAPCHHMLYERQTNGAPLFDAGAFDRRYLRTMADDDDDSSMQHAPAVDSDLQVDPDAGVRFDPDEDDGAQMEQVSLTLTDREKFKVILPIMTNISNLVALHSTTQFIGYVEEFKKIENLVRKGKSVLRDEIATQPPADVAGSTTTTISQPSIAEQLNDPTTSSIHQQNNTSPPTTTPGSTPGLTTPATTPATTTATATASTTGSITEPTLAITSATAPVTMPISTPGTASAITINVSHTATTSHSTPSTALAHERRMLELNENPIAQPTSKFNLSFKSKLQTKPKGRPRKASKQVVFNKSAVDRENKKTKKRQKQQKRRKVTDVLADMTNTGEDEEIDANLSGSELIDNHLMLPSNNEPELNTLGSRGSTDLIDYTSFRALPHDFAGQNRPVTQSTVNPNSISTSPVMFARDTLVTPLVADSFRQSSTFPSTYPRYPTPGAATNFSSTLSSYPQTNNFVRSMPSTNNFVLHSAYVQDSSNYSPRYTTDIQQNSDWSSYLSEMNQK